jgi:hypothetical protein
VLGLPFLDRDFEAVQANNDDAAFAALIEAVAPSFHEDFECVFEA